MHILARFKLPIILALIGGIISCWAVVAVFKALQDNGTTFLGPGDRTVTIPKPGSYILWHEAHTIIAGQFMSFSNELPTGTKISVVKKPEGTEVPLRRDDGITTMTSGTTVRVAVGNLSLAAPGEYQILVSGLQDKRSFYLAEDVDFLRNFFSAVWTGVFGVLFILAAIVSSIYVLIQFRRGSA